MDQSRHSGRYTCRAVSCKPVRVASLEDRPQQVCSGDQGYPQTLAQLRCRKSKCSQCRKMVSRQEPAIALRSEDTSRGVLSKSLVFSFFSWCFYASEF